MSEHFSDRTKMMLGSEGYERLARARVAIFGIGGVGGYATEALARAGVGALDLIDSDTVSVSNVNRQIIATHSTVGEYKTEAARARIKDINPDCKVKTHNLFYTAECADKINLSDYDYIIDAIDSVSSKVELIERATKAGVKIISAMGAGNKLDPTRFRVADISKTAVCPLAKAVRVALRKRGINHLKVVYSEEPPYTLAKQDAAQPDTTAKAPENATPTATCAEASSKITEGEMLTGTCADISKRTPEREAALCTCAVAAKAPKNATPTATCAEASPQKAAYDTRTPPGSISFVPSVMGLILAGEVIKDLSGVCN